MRQGKGSLKHKQESETQYTHYWGNEMEATAIQKYETRGQQLIKEAQSIMIVDDVTRELASEFSSNARKAVKVIEAEFKPDIEQAHKLHKGLLDRMKRLVQPFKDAQAAVDGEIKRDYLEREAQRRKEEREAQWEAAREQRVQEAALAAEVAARLERGDMEGAEELADVEVVVAPPIPMAPVRQTTQSDFGSTTVRKDILVEVVDKVQVIQAIAAGNLPDALVDVNLGMAKRYVRATGKTAMPGFRITETAVVAGRVR